MSLSSISVNNRLFRQEKEAESIALLDMQGMSFIETLVIRDISPELIITIMDGKNKGEQIKVRASDIYGTWNKFLDSSEIENGELLHLTGVVDDLVQQWMEWLLTKFTKRYRLIEMDAQKGWLEEVLYCAARRHIMENKYTASLSDPDVFSSDDVRYTVGMLMAIRGAMKAAAKAINKIVDDPENKVLRESVREEWFKDHYQSIRRVKPPKPIRETLSLLGLDEPSTDDQEREEHYG